MPRTAAAAAPAARPRGNQAAWLAHRCVTRDGVLERAQAQEHATPALGRSQGTSKPLKQATPPDPVQARSRPGHGGTPDCLGTT
jgi:hypothetical protein